MIEKGRSEEVRKLAEKCAKRGEQWAVDWLHRNRVIEHYEKRENKTGPAVETVRPVKIGIPAKFKIG